MKSQPVFPVPILIDTREQRGYSFDGVSFDPNDEDDIASVNGALLTDMARLVGWWNSKQYLAETKDEPYQFAGMPTDKGEGPGPWVIPVEVAKLGEGDYSLKGYEGDIAIERKSLADLFGTVGQGRDRFERELQRLNDGGYRVTEVVVEAELSEILTSPPRHSALSPKTISRSLISWRQKFRNVHWNLLPGRECAEIHVFRILQKFFSEKIKAEKAAKGKM
jgi:hypothetical protein